MNNRNDEADTMHPMYQINEGCQDRPEHMRSMLEFVVGSIRERFHLLPGVLEDMRTNGIESPKMFGFKVDAWEYIAANYRAIWREAMRANTANDTTHLMRVFLRVPGLGLAKAGFACQLFNGTVGCIDTHNAKVYDVPGNMLKFNKNALEGTQTRKIEAYIDLCARVGGSAYLWDSWCDLIAVRYPDNWASGAHVSAAHVRMILNEQ